jgi:dGTPase
VIVRDVVETGAEGGAADFSPRVRQALNGLKDFLTRRVYLAAGATAEAARAQRMLRLLFDHYMSTPEALPPEFRVTNGGTLAGEPLARAVCDFLAGMTDRFAIRTFVRLFVVQALDGGAEPLSA